MNQNEFYAHRQKEKEKIRLAQWKEPPHPPLASAEGPHDISDNYRIMETPMDNNTRLITGGSKAEPDEGIQLDSTPSEAPANTTYNNPLITIRVPYKYSHTTHTLLDHLFRIHDKILPGGDDTAILNINYNPNAIERTHTNRLQDANLAYPYSNISDDTRTRQKLVNNLVDSFGVFLQHHVDRNNPPQPKIFSDMKEDDPNLDKEIPTHPEDLGTLHPLVSHHLSNLKQYLTHVLNLKKQNPPSYEQFLGKRGMKDVSGLLQSMLNGEK